MKKNKKITIISLVVIALLLASVTSVYGVLFSSTVPVDSSVTLHVIGQDDTDVSIDYDTTDLVFNQPGERIDLNLAFQNNSANIFHTYYEVDYDENVSTGLEDAILIYFDGKYYGTLGQMCSDTNVCTLDNDQYITAGSVASPTITNHTISFELHIGASSYFTNKVVKVTLASYAKTANYKSNIFVTNETEWNNAINDVNYGDNYYTIRLLNDIMLTSGYTIKKPCTIDLFGNELIFGGNNVNLIQEGTVVLSTTRAVDYTTLQSSGGFVLNSPNATLDIKEFVHISNDATPVVTDVGALYCNRTTITQFDNVQALILLRQRVNELTKHDLSAGNVRIFGALSFYITQGNLSITAESDYIYNDATCILTVPSSNKTIPTIITIDDTPLEFKIAGTDNQSIFDSIINTELAHLPLTTIDPETNEIILPQITSDMFLPTSLPNRNATIEWWSSNHSLIGTNGKINSVAQGQVSLIARITINDEVFSQKYDFQIYRQDNEMRFQYLLARMNPIELKNVGTSHCVHLPVVDENSEYDYRNITDNNDLGLTALEYSLEPVYYFLNLQNLDADAYSNELYLTEATFQTFAQVHVKGYFGQDCYEGNVGVEIALGNNADLQNSIFVYIQGLFNEQNVLKNIIKTRIADGMAKEKGDFYMPNSHLGFNIEYSIPTALAILQRLVDARGTDTNYNNLIAWAMGSSSNIRADEVVTNIDNAIADRVSDGNKTISGQEEEVILLYTVSAGYTTYAAEWEKHIQPSGNRDLETDASNGIISAITIDSDNDRSLISIDPTKFYSTDHDIPIDVTVRLGKETLGQEIRVLYFGTPGALHADSEGFDNAILFKSVKLQTWQQLPINERKDLPIDFDTVSVAVDTSGLWDYLLLRDVRHCKNLVFENGSDNEEFAALLGWAAETSNILYRADAAAPNIDLSVASKMSDGTECITQDEKDAIFGYCQYNLGFSSAKMAELETKWAENVTQVYKITDINALRNSLTVKSDVLTYVGSNGTDTFTEFANWTKAIDQGWWIFHDYPTLGENGVNNYNTSTECDGAATMSAAEENTIINAYSSFGYDAFATAWALTKTALGYVDGTQILDEFGATLATQLTDIMTTSFGEIVTWATGSEKIKASETLKYFGNKGTLESDGKPTISLAEYQVLVDLTMQLDNNGNVIAPDSALSSNFVTSFVNNSTTPSIFTPQAVANITSFAVPAIEGDIDILTLTDLIPIGMSAILSQVDEYNIGDYYYYTGATTANYTQDTLYRVDYSNGAYELTALGGYTELSTVDDMDAVLTGTPTVNSLYRFSGTTSDAYIKDYIYMVIQDSESLNYYYERLGKPTIESIASGTDDLYYMYITNLSVSVNGLQRFANLRRLSVYGCDSAWIPIFPDSDNANAFLRSVINNCKGLEQLDLHYCNITDISTISESQNLTRLSLVGNTSLITISPITALNTELLEYLDVSKTGINYNYNSCTLCNIYYSYLDNPNNYVDGNPVAPEIYYTNNNTRTLLAPTLSPSKQIALAYLYNLKEIGKVTTNKIMLTTHILIANDASAGVVVSWSVIDDYASLANFSESNGYTLLNNTYTTGTNTYATAVVQALIEVNGEQYIRFFEVALRKQGT